MVEADAANDSSEGANEDDNKDYTVNLVQSFEHRSVVVLMVDHFEPHNHGYYQGIRAIVAGDAPVATADALHSAKLDALLDELLGNDADGLVTALHDPESRAAGADYLARVRRD